MLTHSVRPSREQPEVLQLYPAVLQLHPAVLQLQPELPLQLLPAALQTAGVEWECLHLTSSLDTVLDSRKGGTRPAKEREQILLV